MRYSLADVNALWCARLEFMALGGRVIDRFYDDSALWPDTAETTQFAAAFTSPIS